MSIKSRTNFNESVVSTDSFSPNTSNMSTISKQNLNRLSTDNSTGASYDTSSNVQAIFAQAISKKPAHYRVKKLNIRVDNFNLGFTNLGSYSGRAGNKSQ